jgi:hypothetical protein
MKFRLISLYAILAAFLCTGEESASLPVSTIGFAIAPQKPYIGDKSVMRYTFTAPRDFLAGEIFTSGTADGAETAVLPLEADYFEQSGVTVTAVSLSRRITKWSAESEFALEITFVPWKTGAILFPPVKILGLRTGTALGEIAIPEFTVQSLVETLGETRMRPALPPLIIPGTTYILIGGLISLPVIFALIVLFTRSRLFARFTAHLKLSRGARDALKRIKKLNSRADDMGDAECAREITSLVREYLTKRFFTPYTAFTPDETAQNLSLVESYEDMVGKIAADKNIFSLLKRCETIRFAPNARFLHGERTAMLKDSRGAILYFEHSESER